MKRGWTGNYGRPWEGPYLHETERFTEDDVMDQYLADKRLGLTKDIRKEVYEDCDKIDYSDLQKFASNNISNKPFTYCVLASENKINMKDLAKYGQIKKLTLNELFGY